MQTLKIKQLATGAAILIVGILLGRIFFGGSSVAHTSDEHAHETIAEMWTCAMHPQIRQPEPGKCPLCGMDLIPVESGNTEELGINQIQMTDAAMKLADIQTVIIGTTTPEKQVYLPGRIEADERGIANVTAHFSGRVEKLFADFTGQFINRGQPLATLYSPDLVTAQKELFEALKFRDSNPSFYQAAVQKLKLWELTDRQIQTIQQSGEAQYNFNVFAPRSGTIIRREISEGEHVMDGQTLFEIADLSRLWVLFDAYESDLPWIKVGDSITFNVLSLPGRTFKSMVTFIDPVVNNQTRTASVRTELTNVDNQLKPEMFVEGIINAGLSAIGEALIIPKTAVLWTGKRAVVYVKKPGFDRPTFEFREIELGTDAGEYYVVNRGLSAGEEIAANGVFKIDGAAQLQGKFSMMNPEGTKVRTSHLHQEKNQGVNMDKTGHKSFDVPQRFRGQLKESFNAYLKLMEALVNSNLTEAHRTVEIFINSLNNIDMNQLEPEAHDEWMQDLKVLSSTANSMRNEARVDGIRKILPALSDQLYQTITKFQVQTGGYRMYCPMAFGSHGAFWLSGTEEIRNPYMGEKMLNCGNIDEKLK